MGRHIQWQAILTLTGIAITLAFLGFLSLSRTTITVPDVSGVYTESVAGIPQFINPLLAHYNQVDQDLTALIFEGLTRSDGKGGLEPVLAEKWTASDDGLVYIFRLREDIYWQDGEPFTADDVLFTTGLMQDPQFPGVPSLGELWRTVTVEKLDDYTIRFVLSEPLPSFADYTTIGLLPEHLLTDLSAAEMLSHPFNLAPIGTGPFMLDEVNTEFARLSVNPFYAGPKPRLAQLELRFYASYPETITAYRAGKAQGIAYIPPQSIPQLREIESLSLYTARLSAYDIIYLNLTLPLFEDSETRQALLVALDRQAIIDGALNGQAIVAAGPIHPWSWAYNPNQPDHPFDPEQAKSLLDQAGWVDTDGDGLRERAGQPLAFTLLCGDDPNRIAVARAISRQWRQFGLDVDVEIVGAGLSQRLARRDYQAALVQMYIAGDPDPYPLWHQSQIEAGQNYGGWDHERASILLESARQITNKGQRNDYYFEFQQIFAEETPALILFYPVYTYGVSREVHNVQLAPMTNPRDRFRTLPEWYVLTRRVIYKDTQYQEIAP